jgi:hypothetical protein
MLESTSERDNDQVVSRWADRTQKSDAYNVLMVDQLWIWTNYQVKPTGDSRGASSNEDDLVNGVQYVVTCFPSLTGISQPGSKSLHDLRAMVLDRKRNRRDLIKSTADLISRVLETCFNIFDKLQDAEMLRFF